MNVESLGGHFGVTVEDFDVKSASNDDLRQLLDRLVENRFLVIKDQNLTNDDYVSFGKKWGRPVMLIARKNRLESHPEMIVQSNSEATPDFVRNVANHWHCDSSYEEETSTTTMLYGVTSPDDGGETLFADLVAAFEALPPERKEYLERLEVCHKTSAATPLPDEWITPRSMLPEEFKKSVVQLDPVTHPLVRRHPVNGRKALYGLGGSCYGIVGMPDEEGAELLLDLRRYASQDRFRASYKLMPQDLLLWDNFSVMHRATHIEYSNEPGKFRLNYRISVKGLPDFAVQKDVAA